MLKERESVSEKIEELRKEKKMSYRDLENLTGISYSTINRYVTNKNMKISINNLNKLAKALNVTPYYLMGYTEREEWFEHEEQPNMIRAINSKLESAQLCDDKLAEIYDFICYIENKK